MSFFRLNNAWRIVAIILVGLNLRPVLASVPPLLDLVQAATRPVSYTHLTLPTNREG